MSGPMRAFLLAVAVLSAGGALFLWIKVGNSAGAPVLLGFLIALTCVMRLMMRPK